jgi:hypothetical protein
LRNPAVLFAFTGWNDAGDASGRHRAALVERWNATAGRRDRPEPFTDFATDPSARTDQRGPAHDRVADRRRVVGRR